MGKKTILQINVTANWGSTGKIAEQIGLSAQRRGWDSYVAYGRMMNPSKNNLIKIGSQLDVYEHYAESRFLDREGLGSRWATKRFLQQVDKIQPSIVHLHNIHDHYLNFPLLFRYLKEKCIPVVWTFHDCWAFTGHCCHFVTKDCTRWKTGCYDCPLSPSFSLDCSRRNWELKRSLIQDCNLTVVGCSQWIADFAKESFLKNKRIEVIRNGVDTNVFKPINAASNIKKGRFMVLAVSSIWSDSKGLSDIPKLRQMLPDDYQIVMVGLQKEQIKLLPSGVVGIQHTQNLQEMVKLYSAADVFINPTYADTFPTVNLEALACGTPVVTYATGGSPEAIDSRTGLVVEQGNVAVLAEAIRTLTEHPLSSAVCRERAVTLFGKDHCFEQYVRLYDTLC